MIHRRQSKTDAWARQCCEGATLFPVSTIRLALAVVSSMGSIYYIIVTDDYVGFMSRHGYAVQAYLAAVFFPYYYYLFFFIIFPPLILHIIPKHNK